jgi:monoamine oxidase
MSDDSQGAASRRTFLKTVGAAIGAAALPVGGTAAAPRAGDGAYDVIVIGGGFAGVTAARELGHAGLRTLILEARNRLGGRTFTSRVGGELYELGGTWIHSTQPHVFAEVSRYGLEIVDSTTGMPRQVLWWDGERAREAGIWEMPELARAAYCASDDEAAEDDTPLSVFRAFALLSEQAVAFHQGAGAAFPRPYEPFGTDAWRQADAFSIRDRLDQLDLDPTRAGLLEGLIGGLAHGSLAEASFAEMLRVWALCGNDLTRYMDSLARYRLRDGTISLIEAMVEDGRPDVRLGAPVAEVGQDEDRAVVRLETGERFEARAVIAALPMNVLANIRFSPALDPAKLAASRERHAGAGIKVYIHVRDALPSINILAGEGEPLNTIVTMTSDGEGTELVAFGTDPSRIDVRDRVAVETELRRYLPGVEVTGTLSYDWHLDPYSLGTWCVLKKGQMTKYLKALREPHGLVHFAGADIALGWRGFIDGAIESGNRVAHQVIARLEGREAPAHREAPTAAIADPAFDQCAVCHPTEPGASAGVGPNLRGVYGRRAGSDPDFTYSEALRSGQTTWNETELDAFLRDPAAFLPGSRMPFAGLADEADRAAVIRALRALK